MSPPNTAAKLDFRAFKKQRSSGERRGGNRSAQSFAVATYLIFSLGACKSPTPEDETIRIPKLSPVSQYIAEGEKLSLNLVAYMPDPQFKADRLDPDRYKQSELIFSCVGACPKGLELGAKIGAIDWTPDYDQAGAHFVTFSVRSGIFASERAVQFVVIDKDRPAAYKPQKKISVKEGERLSTTVEAEDPDGDSIAFSCVDSCPSGLIISPSGNIEWTPSYFDAGEVKLKIRAISVPLKRPLIVRGNPPDDVDLEKLMSDLEKTAIARDIALASDHEITVSVENVDRPPTARELPVIEVRESETIRFFLDVVDSDGDDITFFCQAECPEGFTVHPKTGEIVWTPNYDQAGDYSFSIDLSTHAKTEGKAPLQFKIINKNRPPFFVGQAPMVLGREGQIMSFLLRGADPDKEDTPFFRCSANCPTGLIVAPNGLVSWVPDYEQSGAYTVTFEVSDGKATATMNVDMQIDHVNRAPYFTDAPSTLSLQAAFRYERNLVGKDDDREDIGKLRYGCSSGCPAGMTIDSVSGKIRWLPSYTDAGDYDVSFYLTDGIAVVTQVIRMTVIRTDRSPRIDPFPLIQGEELKLLQFDLVGSDPDGDAVAISCALQCPDGLSVTAAGHVSWTPTSQQSGSYSVFFRASSAPVWDATAVKTSDMAVSILIKNFNRSPTLTPLTQTVFEIFEGGHVNSDYLSATWQTLSLQIIATDPDNDPLSYSCVTNCPAGMLVDSATGLVTWEPNYTQAKPSEAPYTGIVFLVSDGEFSLRTDPVTVTVRNVNRPPVIGNITDKTVFENGHLNASESSPTGNPLSFSIVASDQDLDTLTYSCFSGCPAGLTVSLSGSVSWTPTYAQAKNPPLDDPYTNVVFAVSDGQRTSFSNPVAIIVKNVNRAPIIQAMPTAFSVYENGHTNPDYLSPTTSPLSFTFAAVDPDGDLLSYGCSSGCPLGLNLDQSNGQVSWRPSYTNTAQNSSAKPGNLPYSGIIFSVTDALGATTLSAPISITVQNVDRPAEFTIIEGTEYRVCEDPFASGRSTDPHCGGQVTSVQIVAVDPDGDSVSYKCLNVKKKDDPVGIDCINTGQWVYYGVEGSPWLKITTGGSLSFNPKYFEAQAGNAAYTLALQASSRPSLYAGTTLTSDRNVKVRAINIDRPPVIDSSLQTFWDINEAYGRMEVNLLATPDPDETYGEVNTLEFLCSPTSPDSCPGNMKYSEGRVGTASWMPSLAQARFDNAPYYFRYLMRSTPENFYPDSKLEVDLIPGAPDYPPVEITSATVTVVVRNVDHVPYFKRADSDPPEINALAVSASEPDLSTGSIDTETITLQAYDFDQTGNGIENEFGYDSAIFNTETDVSYDITACEIEDYDGNLTTAPCSQMDFIQIQGNQLVVAPPNYDAAIAKAGQAPAVRFITVRAYSAPKAATGWVARDPDYPVWDTIKVAVTVNNIDRPPAAPVYAENSPAGGCQLAGEDPSTHVKTMICGSLAEINQWLFSSSATDIDGDTVAICVGNKYYDGSSAAPGFTAFVNNETITEAAPGYVGPGAADRARPTIRHYVELKSCTTPDASGFAANIGTCRTSQSRRLCSGSTIYAIDYTNLDRPPVITDGGSQSATETEIWRVAPAWSDPDGDPVTVTVRSGGLTSNSTVSGFYTPGFPQYLNLSMPSTSGCIEGVDCQYLAATRTSGPRSYQVLYNVCYSEDSFDPTSFGKPCYPSDVPGTVTVSDVDRKPYMVWNSAATIREGSSGTQGYTLTDDDPYDQNLLYARLEGTVGVQAANITPGQGGVLFDSVGYDNITHPYTNDTKNLGLTARVCYQDDASNCSSSTFPGNVKIQDTDRPPVLFGTEAFSCFSQEFRDTILAGVADTPWSNSLPFLNNRDLTSSSCLDPVDDPVTPDTPDDGHQMFSEPFRIYDAAILNQISFSDPDGDGAETVDGHPNIAAWVVQEPVCYKLQGVVGFNYIAIENKWVRIRTSANGTPGSDGTYSVSTNGADVACGCQNRSFRNTTNTFPWIAPNDPRIEKWSGDIAQTPYSTMPDLGDSGFCNMPKPVLYNTGFGDGRPWLWKIPQ